MLESSTALDRPIPPDADGFAFGGEHDHGVAAPTFIKTPTPSPHGVEPSPNDTGDDRPCSVSLDDEPTASSELVTRIADLYLASLISASS
jgi:hypothetical protein